MTNDFRQAVINYLLSTPTNGGSPDLYAAARAAQRWAAPADPALEAGSTEAEKLLWRDKQGGGVNPHKLTEKIELTARFAVEGSDSFREVEEQSLPALAAFALSEARTGQNRHFADSLYELVVKDAQVKDALRLHTAANERRLQGMRDQVEAYELRVALAGYGDMLASINRGAAQYVVPVDLEGQYVALMLYGNAFSSHRFLKARTTVLFVPEKPIFAAVCAELDVTNDDLLNAAAAVCSLGQGRPAWTYTSFEAALKGFKESLLSLFEDPFNWVLGGASREERYQRSLGLPQQFLAAAFEKLATYGSSLSQEAWTAAVASGSLSRQKQIELAAWLLKEVAKEDVDLKVLAPLFKALPRELRVLLVRDHAQQRQFNLMIQLTAQR